MNKLEKYTEEIFDDIKNIYEFDFAVQTIRVELIEKEYNLLNFFYLL